MRGRKRQIYCSNKDDPHPLTGDNITGYINDVGKYVRDGCKTCANKRHREYLKRGRRERK